MSDAKSDLARALGERVEELHRQRLADSAAGRQHLLPLLPAAAHDEPDEAPEGSLIARRGPGRPAGALNKLTVGWRDYLLAKYQSPLIGMAETAARSVWDLAAELGLEKPTFEQLVELLKIQEKAKVDLAPYLHSKMPVEVEVKGKGLVALHLHMMPAGTSTAGQDARIINAEIVETPVTRSEANQALTPPRPAELDSGELDNSEKSEAGQ